MPPAPAACARGPQAKSEQAWRHKTFKGGGDGVAYLTARTLCDSLLTQLLLLPSCDHGLLAGLAAQVDDAADADEYYERQVDGQEPKRLVDNYLAIEEHNHEVRHRQHVEPRVPQERPPVDLGIASHSNSSRNTHGYHDSGAHQRTDANFWRSTAHEKHGNSQ